MGELEIRRNQGLNGVRYQPVTRMEKPSGGSGTARTAKAPGFTVSDTLKDLLSRVTQAENQTRASHRTLQAGEVVLAEVRDSLERIAELAEKSAGGGDTDRAALQAELERLGEEIDRMTSSATAGGTRLFLDEAAGDDAAALLNQLLDQGSRGDAIRSLPVWLTKGLTDGALTAKQVLSALGLTETASGGDILAALLGRDLEGDTAAGYLASLYLGSMISGSGSFGDIQAALDGLQKLLDQVAEGNMSPDEAIAELTDGAFTSLEDFQAQFTGGTAPGLERFLTSLLLSGGGDDLLAGASLLALLTGGGEAGNLDLMMGLLSVLDGQNAQTASNPDTTGTNAPVPAGPGPSPSSGPSPSPAPGPEPASAAAASPAGTAETPSATSATAEFEGVLVTGRDLSTVSESGDGTLTLSGAADTEVQGAETGRTLRLAGSGTTTLRSADGAALEAESPQARLTAAGRNVLSEMRLSRGAVLTLSGGPLRTGGIRGEGGTLRLSAGAAVTVTGEKPGEYGTVKTPVVLDGPVSFAANALHVTNPEGKQLTAFDNVWKALLPGWSSITSLSLNGQHAKLALTDSDPLRLWLLRGDPSHGSPIHNVIIRGRDAAGRPKIRHTYLRWNQATEDFEEIHMYPNPFTVTGGEEDLDWLYDEPTQTLRIRTDQVTGISGGEGIDAEEVPFSGRLALEDGMGELMVTLCGVVCRVSGGRAFSLGAENQVTLLLQSGSENRFESGPGYAGVSLGEGTRLIVDCPEAEGRNPAGTLYAQGGSGGAGIGRDSGRCRDRTSEIIIQGGIVTARGSGGGAGIGAGKRSTFGAITILGGKVECTGEKGGGAGIGGALGAQTGDITIRGGTVTAQAADHAAAIGAGVQGNCGDILITGAARVAKAQGGDPGADIGACLFGGCGEVKIDGGADIGRARLRTKTGVSLQMGEDAVTLPQFRLSSKTLRLDQLSVATKEAAKAAKAIIEADRRCVNRIQAAYNALYCRLEHSTEGLYSVRRYLREAEGPIRDSAAAKTLLQDARHSISLPSSQAMRTHNKRGRDEVERLLR